MSRWLGFYRSQIGKKVIAAVTGGLMLAFLVGHAFGNLKVFLPNPEPGVPDIDAYAEFLRSIGTPLIPHGAGLLVVRLGLLAAVILHVVCVVQLSARNRAARPVGYRQSGRVPTPWAARWMMATGGVLLAFIVFHILHFTTGTIEPSTFRAGAVYSNLHGAFIRWPFVIGYGLGMGAVAVHVFHGAWSMFQSLGVDRPDRNPMLRRFAVILALGLLLGFMTVPLAFATGLLDSPATLMEMGP